ncbi:hypothetical protein Tco_0911815 [Tanacetum coccineum]
MTPSKEPPTLKTYAHIHIGFPRCSRHNQNQSAGFTARTTVLVNKLVSVKGIMPTEMELTLEQTQQGVSHEVSNIQVNPFTMKMEIMLESTSNKLMVARNPVKKILLKLNLSDHRKLKEGGEVKEVQRSFRHSDTERLSRSDEVLKLKNFKKDATLKLSKSSN